jgi:preprotein translocase subunit SecY
MTASSLILQLIFLLVVVAPFLSLFLAFSSSQGTRQFARFILFWAWLGYGAGTLWCLWQAFAGKSSGIGNGVFLIIAIPVGVVAMILFSVWTAAHRHEDTRGFSSR